MEAILRETIESIAEGVICMEATGRVLLWNKAAERILGMTAEQARNLTFPTLEWKLIHEDGSPCPVQDRPSRFTIETGQAMSDQVLGIQKPDGDVVWLSINTRPLFHPGEELPYAVIVSFSDVSDRKRAMEALRRSEESWRQLFQSSPAIAVLTTADEGRFLNANAAFLRFTGYALKDVVGKTTLDLGFWRDPRQRESELVRSLREHGEMTELELNWKTRDGQTRTVLWWAAPMEINGRTCLLSHGIDITERKQAEDALRKSEEKLLKMFQLSPVWLTVSSRHEGRFMEVNDAFLRESGWKREEIIGRSGIEAGFWPDVAQRTRAHEIINRQGRLRNFEATVRVKSGLRCILWSAEVIEVDGEQLLLNVGLDITERKRAEQALIESEERFRSVVEQAADAFFVIDEDERIQDVNRAACASLGYTREELLGLSLHDVDPQAKLDQHSERFWRTLAPGRSVRFETRHRRKDGSTFPAEVSISLLEMGGRRFVQGLARDITERKAAEEKLRESGERITALFNATSDSVILLDPDGVVLAINEHGAGRRGKRPEELAGKSLRDLLRPELARARKARINEMVRDGRPTVFEEERDGCFYVIRMFPILDSRGKVTQIASFSRDVTERKRAEEERAGLEAQLRQAHKMEAIGALAGGIAHDFNNILAAIMGYSELALLMTQNGETNADELAKVLQAAERARNLVKQILTFSRKVEAEKRPLDLNLTVKETLRMLESALPKMISIETNLAPDLKPIMANATQMEQVVMNLAANAADACPKAVGWLSRLKTQPSPGACARPAGTIFQDPSWSCPSRTPDRAWTKPPARGFLSLSSPPNPWEGEPAWVFPPSMAS